MKKLLLALILMPTLALAQTTVSDSIVMGSGYANQVYYSMANGVVAKSAQSNWHIAIMSNVFDGGIWINEADSNMCTVYLYNGSVSNFSTLDTTGMAAGWTKLYNTDTSWSMGALNTPGNPLNFDYGWGTYDLNTNNITGSRLFVLKVPSGNGYVYRKLEVELKQGAPAGTLNGGDVVMHIASLDNTIDRRDTFRYNTFKNQLFGYYNILTGSFLSREPASYQNWDLTMTSYVADLGGGIEYPVVGLLSNNFYTNPFAPTPPTPDYTVQVAKAQHVDVNAVLASSYTGKFSTNISTIGYDWKTYDQTHNSYSLVDSLAYFVELPSKAIYKLYVTYYGASTNGVTRFNKTEVAASTNNISANNVRFMVVGNPVTSGNMQLLLADNTQTISNATLTIVDLTGNIVKTMYIGTIDAKLHAWEIPVHDMANGMYLVQLKGTNTNVTARAVIAR